MCAYCGVHGGIRLPGNLVVLGESENVRILNRSYFQMLFGVQEIEPFVLPVGY